MRRLAALTLLLAVLDAGRAHAYVRYVTSGSKPYFWQLSCAPITVYTGAFTEMTTDEIAKSFAAAAHTWSPDSVTCLDGVSHPFLEIVPTMTTGAGPPYAKDDARNTLVFQTETWNHPGEALALTTVFTKGDGRIVDADIEVNATAGLVWLNLDTPVTNTHGQDVHDLQNALTHEFGHFIGLDHTCFIPGTDPNTGAEKIPPKDNLGNEVPDCDLATPEIRATVMFPSVERAETSKRVLSSDEIHAVCDIYPPANDPRICTMDSPNDGLGCATAPRSPGGSRLLALVAALGAVGLTRARRRGRRQL